MTSQQMKEIDRLAAEQFFIPSSILMERAGLSVVLSIEQVFKNLSDLSFLVLCGPGNNGGDGFVAARDLLDYTDYVTIVFAGDEKKLSVEAGENFKRLKSVGGDIRVLGVDVTLDDVADIMKKCDIVIDALLGIGIKGEVRGQIAELIKLINLYSNYVVSIDIPSGLDSDTGKILGIAVKADLTVTFGLPKPCNLLYPGRELCGQLKVASIGIPRVLRESKQFTRQIITKQLVSRLIPERFPDSHKGSYGKLLVIAGSAEYPGAAVLTSLSALRVGCGYVHLLTCSPANEVAIQREPGLVATVVDKKHFCEQDVAIALELSNNADAVVIGPGITCNDGVRKFLSEFLENLKVPVVIDADGLNCLARDLNILEKIQVPAVLTPHPAEFARLTGEDLSDVKYNYLLTEEFSKKYNLVVVLKSATTIISTPNETFFNLTGNTSLSKAGSGDILAGMIGGFAAQGLNQKDASICSVYLHGLASEHYRHREGSMLVSELLDLIPVAMEEV
ncbi:NAD(P)H-hydrate dehydratase [Pseudothermotoga sp.]|uniref:NAD(P)H-hydrate dehydratase n=1 Tax=Pseudothermotoga sp. TaxID=2033661 RepID=UPI00338D7275